MFLSISSIVFLINARNTVRNTGLEYLIYDLLQYQFFSSSCIVISCTLYLPESKNMEKWKITVSSCLVLLASLIYSYFGLYTGIFSEIYLLSKHLKWENAINNPRIQNIQIYFQCYDYYSKDVEHSCFHNIKDGFHSFFVSNGYSMIIQSVILLIVFIKQILHLNSCEEKTGAITEENLEFDFPFN